MISGGQDRVNGEKQPFSPQEAILYNGPLTPLDGFSQPDVTYQSFEELDICDDPSLPKITRSDEYLKGARRVMVIPSDEIGEERLNKLWSEFRERETHFERAKLFFDLKDIKIPSKEEIEGEMREQGIATREEQEQFLENLKARLEGELKNIAPEKTHTIAYFLNPGEFEEVQGNRFHDLSALKDVGTLPKSEDLLKAIQANRDNLHYMETNLFGSKEGQYRLCRSKEDGRLWVYEANRYLANDSNGKNPIQFTEVDFTLGGKYPPLSYEEKMHLLLPEGGEEGPALGEGFYYWEDGHLASARFYIMTANPNENLPMIENFIDRVVNSEYFDPEMKERLFQGLDKATEVARKAKEEHETLFEIQRTAPEKQEEMFDEMFWKNAVLFALISAPGTYIMLKQLKKPNVKKFITDVTQETKTNQPKIVLVPEVEEIVRKVQDAMDSKHPHIILSGRSGAAKDLIARYIQWLFLNGRIELKRARFAGNKKASHIDSTAMAAEGGIFKGKAAQVADALNKSWKTRPGIYHAQELQDWLTIVEMSGSGPGSVSTNAFRMALPTLEKEWPDFVMIGTSSEYDKIKASVGDLERRMGLVIEIPDYGNESLKQMLREMAPDIFAEHKMPPIPEGQFENLSSRIIAAAKLLVQSPNSGVLNLLDQLVREASKSGKTGIEADDVAALVQEKARLLKISLSKESALKFLDFIGQFPSIEGERAEIAAQLIEYGKDPEFVFKDEIELRQALSDGQREAAMRRASDGPTPKELKKLPGPGKDRAEKEKGIDLKLERADGMTRAAQVESVRTYLLEKKPNIDPVELEDLMRAVMGSFDKMAESGEVPINEEKIPKELVDAILEAKGVEGGGEKEAKTSKVEGRKFSVSENAKITAKGVALGGISFTIGMYGAKALKGMATGDYSELKNLSLVDVAKSYGALSIGGGGTQVAMQHIGPATSPIKYLNKLTNPKGFVGGRAIPLFTALMVHDALVRGEIKPDEIPVMMGNVLAASAATRGILKGLKAAKWATRLGSALKLVKVGGALAAGETGGATLLGTAAATLLEFAFLEALAAGEKMAVEWWNRDEVKENLTKTMNEMIRLDGELKKGNRVFPQLLEAEIKFTTLKLLVEDQYRGEIAFIDEAAKTEIEKLEEQRDSELAIPLSRRRRSAREINDLYGEKIVAVQKEATEKRNKLKAEETFPLLNPKKNVSEELFANSWYQIGLQLDRFNAMRNREFQNTFEAMLASK